MCVSVCACLWEVMPVCLLSYLESEWEVRRGSSRDFGADQMQSSHCRVPLQDNSSDCGLYLLQYVESFLKVKNLIHFQWPVLCFVDAQLYSWSNSP